MNRVQASKLIFSLIYGCLISLVLFSISKNTFSVFALGVLSYFNYIFIATMTLTFAFFSYVDNVEQKIPDLKKNFNLQKVDEAHSSFVELKKELLSNIILVISLFILEKGLSYLEFPSLKFELLILKSVQIDDLLLAIRFSMFMVAIFAFLIQAKAFFTSLLFRYEISKGFLKK